jgi:hypothetical protein
MSKERLRLAIVGDVMPGRLVGEFLPLRPIAALT